MATIFDYAKPVIDQNSFIVGPTGHFEKDGRKKIALLVTKIIEQQERNIESLGCETPNERVFHQAMKACRYNYYKMEKARKMGLKAAQRKIAVETEHLIAKVESTFRHARADARARVNTEKEEVYGRAALEQVLKSLCINYGGFQYSYGRIIVVIPPLTCRCLVNPDHEYQFDKFIIEMPIKAVGAREVTADGLRVRSLDEAYRRGGCDHPHVQDGVPCLGTAYQGVVAGMYRGDFASVAATIKSMLECYNLSSPHVRLDSWSEEYEWEDRNSICDSCSEEVDSEYMRDVGGSTYCEECSTYCEFTDETVHESDAVYSEQQGVFLNIHADPTIEIENNETAETQWFDDEGDPIPNGWRMRGEPNPLDEEKEEEESETEVSVTNETTPF